VPITPPRTPTERFAAILLCVSKAVGSRTGWGLHLWVIALIVNRIRRVKQGFFRLAARIQAGSYVPRKATTRRQPAERKPPRKNPLPRKFAWLLPLVPEATCYGSHLQNLLAEPEMAALMAAAPVPMRRLLGPLCHMLGVRPPPPIARPRKPRQPRAKPPDPPPRPPLEVPAWMRIGPDRKEWSLYRMCGRRRRT
jgi:hypothetical protein